MIYWLAVLCFKFLFFVVYRHRVYGLENIPEGAAIIAPNHVSYFDPPVIAASVPGKVSFLAKEPLFESRILGPLIRRLNAYPVSGKSSDLASFKVVCKLLNEGHKVTIFPEGVRAWDGQLQSLQSGVAMLALRCGCPIVPTYIVGTYEIYPRHRRFPKLWGKTACYFGEPIYPRDFAALDKKSAQQAMTQKLIRSLEKLQEISIAKKS